MTNADDDKVINDYYKLIQNREIYKARTKLAASELINSMVDRPARGQFNDYVADIMKAYWEHHDAVLIIKASGRENNPLIRKFKFKGNQEYQGLKVVIPYEAIKDLSFPALFTGLYKYAEGKKSIARMSRPGYFLDLTLEFDEKVKEKLIAQHETLTSFFNEIKDYLEPNPKTGLLEFTVKLHRESSASVMQNQHIKTGTDINKKLTYKAGLFDEKSFEFSVRTGPDFNDADLEALHNAIASLQFYLLSFPGMFLSIYCGKDLVLALNRAGFQTGKYMQVGLAKHTENDDLIWLTHKNFKMNDYNNYAKEYRTNLIDELGSVLLRHNMGLSAMPRNFELQGKMLWFFWQKCVKPTLDEFLQEKLGDKDFKVNLYNLGSPIEFNTNNAYEKEIIPLDDTPFWK
ncbi:MAG: hypothetical protein ACTSQP_01460 [Promethearchaeota archaeon]